MNFSNTVGLSDDLMAQGWESGPDLGIEIKRQRMKSIDEENII